MPIVTREQARVALATRVNTLASAWTSYALQVEYDNKLTVNRATQSLPFLCVSMVYVDGEQIALGPNGGNRAIGVIVLEANVKEGSGTAEANALLDYFYPQIHKTDSMPPLRTYVAKFSSKPAKDGWVAQAALIPFWYDSLPV